ncbi:MAG: hypothetical protein V7776_10275 [Halopseudomonas aestusnigri]
MSKRTVLLACVSLLALTSNSFSDPLNVRVEIIDKSYQPAGGFLAYTEFELSGEPMAESLGLDLDVLDPNQLNQPTAFDYATGIESYEYSEEAMYAVNYQSRMGPHLVNGPTNAGRGGSMKSLGSRMVELSDAVGFPAEDIPRNMYPLSFPYMQGVPEYAGPLDTTVVGTEEVELLDFKEETRVALVDIPAYAKDYSSLGWREDKMDKSFTPATLGGQMLKDVMWSQDFLGGMHVILDDTEVEATSSGMDQDGVHALGVSSADGLNGVILTEITHDKLLMLRDRFGYDGNKLGAIIGPDYDPLKTPVWFPHKVAISEQIKNGTKAVGGLQVKDARSSLRDTWMLLWPLSEFYAFADQRTVNENQNPAFLAVFDGAPFANAPVANMDGELTNDIAADDPFSVSSTLVNAAFKNLDALHFNEKIGSFIDSYDGKQSNHITTYDAAYLLQALTIYQRSQDALPVGYASADASASLDTQQGKRATYLIKAQADFILKNLIDADGLAVSGFEIGIGSDGKRDIGTQFAVIRGLSAAFKATGDILYRKAARALFVAVEIQMFDPAIGTYADVPGKPTEHTPYTVAAISSGLRNLLLTLRNEEGENVEVLELGHLAGRYESWFKTIINGRNTHEGMQLAEWLGDTGENISSQDSSGDLDQDGVALITAAGGKYGTAMTMAGKVLVSAEN